MLNYSLGDFLVGLLFAGIGVTYLYFALSEAYQAYSRVDLAERKEIFLFDQVLNILLHSATSHSAKKEIWVKLNNTYFRILFCVQVAIISLLFLRVFEFE